MRTLLLLPFLLMFVSPGQSGAVSGDSSPLVVLSFKWDKSRQVIEKPDSAGTSAPAAAMNQSDKNFERNAREQAPAGWKGDDTREKQVLNALFPIMSRDRQATQAIFEIIKQQPGY